MGAPSNAEMLRLVLISGLIAAASAGYSWDSCGTKLDRLKTSKLTVDGKLEAGSKVTVTASGATDLHVPLDSGAWQVRVYETGVAKETHTEFGDLMKALKFDDDKNTTFTVSVSFTLPAKQASGEFDANLVAVDQAKADYMCLDIKYKYAAELSMAIESNETCLHEEDTEDHKCFEACAESKFATKGIKQEGKCPSNYNTVDKTQTVEQCPDGVTSIRYCNPINVTIATKGEAGDAFTLAAEDKVCIHKLDSVDHKCYEACAESKFAMKGMNKRGNCPSNYNTVDKTQTVKQCPDGKTNPRYCNPINVTIETKGEAKVLSLAIESNETCLHEEDTEDHKCFEACAESKFATKGIKQEGKCPSNYNTVDKTQT